MTANLTRSKEVPKAFFKDYGGILHTDGYAAYEKDIGAEGMTHACCIAHYLERGFICRALAKPLAKGHSAHLVGSSTQDNATCSATDATAVKWKPHEHSVEADLSIATAHASFCKPGM